MKVKIHYEDNASTSLHKTLKITLPKKWITGPTSKVLNQFVESYNASDLGKENHLNADKLHFALRKDNGALNTSATGDINDTENMWTLIASDAITMEVIPDRIDVYIRHGPSHTLADIVETERKKKQHRIAIQDSMASCTHLGCNKRFPKGGPYPECVYHKSPPVFHETSKFWSCCPDKKAYDWDDFQAIKGCQEGVCTEVKDENKKSFLGGCDVRDAAFGDGGEKLKSVENFNKQCSLDTLRAALCDIGVDNELFDKTLTVIENDVRNDTDKETVADILGKKLKDAFGRIVAEQQSIS